MKTKLWFAVAAGLLSVTAFSQKKKQQEKQAGKQGMMTSNNSTKEELISILKKDDHFYEITSQRKDPKNIEKTVVTVYEVMNGQKRIVEEYNDIYEVMASPYKEAIMIN
ncbi:hypothetical protein [Chryseobacterium culicis]|uniref:Uncharacterized protein n=1 Tax=Chryseobacterium culicis TaxID=680127 RepID=A0A1H6HAK9_CHRCI|nr:hypothetical protein [Chryseobacterium culicis]SEH32142.1 hypothetical protein SAMN05421593_1678 [Chryseobacterium culicis]